MSILRSHLPTNLLLLLLGVWGQQSQNFLDNTRQAEDIDSFLAAMQFSGQFDLVNDAEILQTIFVPKKAVFEEYFKALELGLSDPNNDFSGILQFIIPMHIVPGVNLLVKDFYNGQKLTTASGDVLNIKKWAGNISVSFKNIVANIGESDIQAGNTVFHVVDAIILDDSVDVFQLPTEQLATSKVDLQLSDESNNNADLSDQDTVANNPNYSGDVTCPTCA